MEVTEEFVHQFNDTENLSEKEKLEVDAYKMLERVKVQHFTINYTYTIKQNSILYLLSCFYQVNSFAFLNSFYV